MRQFFVLFLEVPTGAFLEYGLLGALFVVALGVIRYLYLENKQLQLDKIHLIQAANAEKMEASEKYVASVGALRDVIMNGNITTKGYLEKHISKEHKDILEKMNEIILNKNNA